LAFVSLQGKNALLYTVKPDGSDLRQVSSTVAWYTPNQQWSPDGSRLAFLAEYQGVTTLYITGKSNASPQRLTIGLDVRSYDWSPSGKEIAFAAIRGDVEDIYIVSLGTLNVINLTAGSSGVNTEPKWSHDGKCIAFLSVPGAKNIKQTGGSGDRVYIMDANGANKRRVKPESPLPQEHLSECAPAWSPDDHYLAFNHGCLSVDPWNIYLFELQTGNTFQVTTNGFDDSMDRWCVWLSNEQLLVRSFRADVSGEHYRVMNRDGTNDRRLLPWDIENVNLIDWTSDLRWFVWQEFEWGDKGTNEIVIGDLTTKQITRTGVKGCSPKWSPSGFWIAYTTECLDQQKSDVWVMDRSGKNQRNLAQLQGINHFSVWSPK
jgi:Tol biopolymer transport system component